MPGTVLDSPACIGDAPCPESALCHDLARWGTGGQPVAAVCALALADARSRRPGEPLDDLPWLRETAREWLFHHLFDPHAGELTRRVRVRYPQLPAPEAVVSRAWLRARAWWFRDDREPVTNPMGWLMWVTGYASLDGSGLMSGPFAPWPAGSGGPFEPADHTADRPDAVAEANERHRLVELALAGLSGEKQTLYRLKYEEELSFEEIGTVLGVSAEAARKRLTRLLIDLRTLFQSLR
jgi:RNA polymerase sigma factor (sigma-70 family)